ncbi:MAG: PUA domain-containing protein [Candidatus Methanomethylicia archaeon]
MFEEEIRKIAIEYNFPEDLLIYLNNFWDVSRLESIISSLRHPPKYYSIRINTLKTTIEEVYTSLEKAGINLCYHPFIDEALLIEVKGPHQIKVTNKIVVANKYAAESVYIGADLYSRGIKSAKNVKKGDFVTIMDENGNPIANGIAVKDEKEILNNKSGLAVKVLESVYRTLSLRSLDEYIYGKICDQSIPAMLTSIVLDPQPNEVIVDMCAAPGGKATHIAQITFDKASIYAFDNSPSKLSKLNENIIRLGIKSIRTFLSDSRYIHVDYPYLKADRILLDPPCSALGVRPKLFERKSVADIMACAKYQMQFFKSAVEILKRGGVLVYSTCTITPHENEMIVKNALENFPLELDGQKLYLGERGLNIISKHDLLQRFYPDKNDTSGYFIAKFIKV